ncbi:hypothetical protein FK513_30730, partial [Klebsiella pneumoniae]|nr:hypothetical protein [Klebsiella pneumoniae]
KAMPPAVRRWPPPQVYASQTTLQQLLSSPGYLNQVAAARLTIFWPQRSDRRQRAGGDFQRAGVAGRLPAA